MEMASPAIRCLLLLLLFLGLAMPPPSMAVDFNNILSSGDTLYHGQSLSWGPYSFNMQFDCNLVLYDQKVPVWATNTTSILDIGCHLTLQADGNLVVSNILSHPLWASGTQAPKGYYVLILQRNRNVVVYGTARWASGTYKGITVDGSAASTTKFVVPKPTENSINVLRTGESLKMNEALYSGTYALLLQSDCDLVLYDGEKPVKSITGTSGAAKNCTLFMQSDGRLVLYHVVTGATIWQSDVKVVRGFYALVLQKDRNVVVYGPDRWTSKTNIKSMIGDGPADQVLQVDDGNPESIRRNREISNLMADQ